MCNAAIQEFNMHILKCTLCFQKSSRMMKISTNTHGTWTWSFGKKSVICVHRHFLCNSGSSTATKCLNKAIDAKKHCAVTSSQSTLSLNLFSFTVMFCRYSHISVFLEVLFSDLSSNIPARTLTEIQFMYISQSL